MAHKIVITKRTEDYHACVDGDPRFWDCGKTPDEAIGALCRTWPEMLGITVEMGVETPEESFFRVS